MASTTSAVSEAIAAAEAEAWPACLHALLVAWREHRAPELAALIDRVAGRIAAPEVEATAAAIMKRIAAASDADVTPILATIVRQVRVLPAAVHHAVALARREPDPRVATVLAMFFERSPYRSAAGPLETEVVDALDAMDDPRYREHIVAAADGWAARRGRFTQRRIRIDHLVAVAAKVRARQPPPPFTIDLSAIDNALARTRSDTAHLDTLLAAVYADPANDAPRLVYADALQDAGDPRGEFITLQCTNPGTRRERALQRSHERAWLGSADRLLQKQHLIYRRGFLAAGRLAVRGFPSPPTDPIWQTLEQIDVCDGWGKDVARWLLTLAALRHVDQFYAHDLDKVTSVAWTTLGVRYATQGDLANITAARFPALEVLDLSAMPAVEAAEALRGLPIRPRRIRIQARLRGEVPPIEACLGVAEIELVRAYAFRSTAPSIVLSGTHATLVYAQRKIDLAYPIGVLPLVRVRTVSLEAPPHSTIDPRQRALLERTLVEHAMTWETRRASTARPAP